MLDTEFSFSPQIYHNNPSIFGKVYRVCGEQGNKTCWRCKAQFTHQLTQIALCNVKRVWEEMRQSQKVFFDLLFQSQG
jgi:hypothetical protein